jgi:N-acetylglucosaminyl-diphospho-decaprenol L-rhamnosyltransferase
MPAPAVLIVNFNSGDHLRSCLESVRAHAPAARTLVIDNASIDGSADPAASGSGVSLVRNSTNVGFARAVNQGMAQTASESVLLLNPDCRVLPGALDRLEAELAAHTECAVAGPRILDEDGGVQGSVRGDPTLLTGLFGRTTLLTRLLPRSRLARHNVRVGLETGVPGASFVTDWLSGAAMLIRRPAFQAVGGFDERYFLYWEDADLCRRLRRAGYSIRHVPLAAVIHTGGRSSQAARTLAIREFHRSAYTYYATHVARTALARGLAWTMLEARCQWKMLAARLSNR